ncbi:MAG: glycoside hydrolase family 2 [Bacteroidales bacterium]|nr:glycoside hydrolase family 2 [Candidatus Cryptobacteroides fimicaballi]
MKKFITVAAALSMLVISNGCRENTIINLRNGFREIPDSIQTAAYWYWMNDNISEEGVVKDLEAMAAVGINRAYIGNQQADDIPYGDIKLGSDQWFDITRTALKTAADLGIEIGIFNCPGWSQSGGPWVKEEESMRRLVMKEGYPSDITDKSIVRVLAMPPIEGTVLRAKVKSPEGKACKAEFAAPEGFVARTVSVKASARTDRLMKVLADGAVIREFYFDRHRTDLNVGFDPLAPVVINLPETSARKYTVVIEKYYNPADVDFEVVVSDIPEIEKWPEKTLVKMFQDPLPMWDHYMWTAQGECSDKSKVVDPEMVIDLTEGILKGFQSPNIPDSYRVVTFYMETTGVTNAPAVPEGTGLEIDKMSRKHIETHFDAFVGKLIERIPASDRRTWTVVVQDSYETGGLNWTDDMAEVFRERYGYDPVPFLPAMAGITVGSADRSERFLWDLRRLIADRVAYDYVGGLRDICHRYGMETWLETYGHWGFPSEFLMYGGQSDQIAGEFWSEGDLGDIENRAASSCGHIYGKNKVWAESCTAGSPQYSRYPRLMKERVDRFFCEGINATLLHLFIQQPDDRKPGLDAWFGNEFNRNNTWFEALDLFIQYLKRCNLMLQQGRYIADAAYFIGEDAPKMTGVCNPVLPQGYSFDYINAEVLLKHSRVKDGKLVLDSGMEYAVLVLPDQNTMRPEVLKCIAQMVEDGLTITGPAPVQSPSLQNYPAADEEVRTVAAAVWNGSGRYGKGRVYDKGTAMETIFADLGIKPDFTTTVPADGKVSFIHRSLGREGDIYFVANQKEAKAGFKATFRVDGGFVPELWYPVDGHCEPVSWTRDENGCSIDMSLDSLQSVFVVFGKNGTGEGVPMQTAGTVSVGGPWKVNFSESCGNAAFETEMAGLGDWSESPEPAIKYYSGKATYSNRFSLDTKLAASDRVLLDLGHVMVMGKVRINGNYAGGVWTAPYVIDITDLVCEGENTVEVDVWNNWRNRLIGDDSLPEEQRKTWTNLSPWKAGSDLQPSGLMGPVTVKILTGGIDGTK